MKLQIASDLHLELLHNPTFSGLIQHTDADVLILAGDIGYPEDQITRDFIHWCCKFWPAVLWILGNHEYYSLKQPHITMTEKEVLAENYMLANENLSVLLNTCCTLKEFPNFKFLGTTMWTELSDEDRYEVSSALNDFRTIYTSPKRNLSAEMWNHLHRSSRDFLQTELASAQKDGQQAIVLTHHLPTYRMILPQYKDSPYNAGFASPMDDLLQHPALALWVCGHSHGQMTLSADPLNEKSPSIVLNARGYPNEDSQFTYSSKRTVTL
jgi:predicted MPP superfamily phosphohydrolase